MSPQSKSKHKSPIHKKAKQAYYLCGKLNTWRNWENDEHHRIWISIYRKYHNIPGDNETEQTGESPASGAPLSTYQVLAPTAAEIADNDCCLLSGARKVLKASVEGVAARKELFMCSPDTANAALQYKFPADTNKVYCFGRQPPLHSRGTALHQHSTDQEAQ